MKRVAVSFLSIVLVLCAACAKGESKIKSINSFENIILTVSGMRISERYELIKNDDGFILSEYEGFYGLDDDVSKEKYLVARVACNRLDYSEMVEFLNECHFGSWNGFSRSAKHVYDGETFTLNAIVNGNQKIYASGSNAFPKRYNDFVAKLDMILSEQYG